MEQHLFATQLLLRTAESHLQHDVDAADLSTLGRERLLRFLSSQSCDARDYVYAGLEVLHTRCSRTGIHKMFQDGDVPVARHPRPGTSGGQLLPHRKWSNVDVPSFLAFLPPQASPILR